MHVRRRRRRRALFELHLERCQPVLHHAEDGALRELPVGFASLARGDAGKDLDAILDAVDGPDVESSLRDRLRHVVAKDHVRHVGSRDHDALLAGEATDAADVEEALDLGGGATDGLHVAELVHRAGDGDLLRDRHVRQRREQRVQLRRGGRVAVDVSIELLERQAGVEQRSAVLAEPVREEAAEDEEALVVDAPGHLALALHHHHAAATSGGNAGHARGAAERDIAEVVDGEGVDLPDARALGGDSDRSVLHRLQDVLRNERGSVGPLIEGAEDVTFVDTVRAIVAGPIVCLPHDVDERRHVRGESAPVLHHP